MTGNLLDEPSLGSGPLNSAGLLETPLPNVLEGQLLLMTIMLTAILTADALPYCA